MRKLGNNSQGFTLIELLVMVAIILTLSSIAIPMYKSALERARSAQCATTRRSVEQAEMRYSLDNNTSSLNISQLINEGYLGGGIHCSSKGEYVWITTQASDSGYPKLGCSIHFWVEPLPPGGGGGEPGTVFSSSFDSMEGLTPLMGKWKVVNGVLIPVGGKGEHRLAFGDADWTDYQLTVNATLYSGKGYGLYYRCDGNPKITGYIFQYDPGLGNRLVVRKVVGGHEQAPFQKTKMPDGFPIYEKSHEITIVVQGKHHIIKIDGKVILEFDDNEFSSGMAGFRSWHGSEVEFNDVAVIL